MKYTTYDRAVRFLILLSSNSTNCTQNKNVKKCPKLYRLNLRGGYHPINDQKMKDTIKIKDSFFNAFTYNFLSLFLIFFIFIKHRVNSGETYKIVFTKSVK